MKKIIFILTCFVLLAVILPQTTEAGILDWKASGWVEGSVYPPHNEFDPNPGIAFPDRTVASYGLKVYLEARPKDFDHLFIFVEPFALFGDRRPQLDYNWSAKPIVMNLIYGAGFQLIKKPDVQIKISHGEWIDLGGYKGEKLQWNAVQIRWTFGK